MTAEADLGREKTQADDAAREFVTTTIACQLFGIPVQQVEDILAVQRITRIPLAPDWVAGVLNLRGRIVTAIDVRRWLGLPRSERHATKMSIAIAHDSELYSLIVDDVGDVLTCPTDAIGPNPPTLDLAWREVSMGVARLDGALVVVLDARKLIASARRDDAER
jgi:purine-binding chemotaxis protein CheW